MKTVLIFLSTICLLIGCSQKSGTEMTLFSLMPSSHTGIDFRNDLKYDEKFNPYTFRNFYNGAGVALGDINNDGLVDIFLAGNQSGNKLYLNKGNFEFEDITEKAGLAVPGIWSTGVSMADINGDGLLDIYICKSGPLGGQERHNALYINNGDLTFTEMAKEYGIADEGLSQHAVFFDYDKDGDLDMYLLNNSARSVGIYDLRKGQREIRDPEGGNKLYRNDGGRFTDVSEEAGIYGSAIGYGLGVTVADLNKDGWPDLYVSNDFFEKDYLYLNNQDGTFTEALEDMMTEISMGAMGADIADLDNNGWPDIYVTEMLPENMARFKTKTPFEDWDKYQANVAAGYHHQFTRNTLQRNLGRKPDSDQVHFIDIARQARVHATDWSWGALIFDMDNDGLRDIFVANGIVKDLTDFDYVDYYMDNQDLVAQFRKDSVLITKMIEEFPSTPLQNYLFKNLGDFQFENLAATAGMEQLGFSTGAAYADLDNDGDLDLVVNNLNGEVFIFRNNTETISDHHFLQFDFGGHFGTQLTLYAGDQMFYAEHNPVKGYMSSVDHRVHVGLGQIELLDSIHVLWPNGQQSMLYDIPSDQLLKLNPRDASTILSMQKKVATPKYQINSSDILDWQHQESAFIDFDRDRLRFHMVSNEGPKMAIGDVNGDGLDDLVITGAKGQPSALFLQTPGGTFQAHQMDLFETDKLAEDVDVLLFDANGNGHLDLYLASGSIEFGNRTPYFQDRLYINDGKGNFTKSQNALPGRNESSSFVRAFDHNGDGHLDLLVGTRAVPFAYGIPVDVRLLENQGDGTFVDQTSSLAPDFMEIGLTRDAAILDLNGDGQEEIIIIGEWMGIKVFKMKDGRYSDISSESGFGDTEGLWNTIEVLDANGDGHPDLLIGNMGLNTRLLASSSEPLELHINDFDQNGTIEHILTQYDNGVSYPLVLKPALLKQLPGLRKQLLRYADYQDKTIAQLFPESILERSVVLQAKTLATSLFINQGNGKFEKSELPSIIQSSPVYAVHSETNETGHTSVFLGGNQSRIKPELGINMGSYGWMMEQSESKQLEVIPAASSGIYIPGEIRDIKKIKVKEGAFWVFLRNNDTPVWVKENKN